YDHVERIAVAAQRMGDEAVVSGVAHGGVEEAVDEQRAGLLVDLVFDRLAAKGDFDDDIEVVGRVLAHGDGVDIHAVGFLVGREGRPAFCLSGPINASHIDCTKAGRARRGRMMKTIAKGTLVAVLAVGVSASAGAQEMRSEYSEIDLEDCTTVFVYEAGAGWACPGLRGFPLLVAERDLRFVVSFGFSAFDEKAFEQRFMRFNSVGVILEWLVAEGDEMGPIPVAAIQRFYLDGYEEGDPLDEVLVVTRIEEGN